MVMCAGGEALAWTSTRVVEVVSPVAAWLREAVEGPPEVKAATILGCLLLFSPLSLVLEREGLPWRSRRSRRSVELVLRFLVDRCSLGLASWCWVVGSWRLRLSVRHDRDAVVVGAREVPPNKAKLLSVALLFSTMLAVLFVATWSSVPGLWSWRAWSIVTENK